MGLTKIEWTSYTMPDGRVVQGYTFNPWIGCDKVSAGCKNCYAEYDQDTRRGRVKWGKHGTRSVTSYSYWRQLIKWNREAAAANERRRVFCASLADVFEDWAGQLIDAKGNPLWWPDEEYYFSAEKCDVDDIPIFSHQTTQIEHYVPLTLDIIRLFLFRLMEKMTHLDFLLVTKRIENTMRMVPDHWKKKFPANIWIGTTVENQEAADIRIPELIKVPAIVRFLSCEPLLGPLDLGKWVRTNEPDNFDRIHWVICGGESGNQARPMRPDWARDLCFQCETSLIPFFFKQWGEYMPGFFPNLINQEVWVKEDGTIGPFMHGSNMQAMTRIGKKTAGAKLDGQKYNDSPNPERYKWI